MSTYEEKGKTKDQLINELQDSERHYRLLAENMTDAISFFGIVNSIREAR